MIFTNTKLKVEIREMSFGHLSGVSIGEKGRGRHEQFIPCPEDIEEIEGVCPNLSIGTTRSGKCRINRGNTGNFVILSSQGGYTRRGDGIIISLKSQPIEVLVEANGADGNAGRIGQWSAVVAKMPSAETFIRVCRGGGSPSDLIWFNGYSFKFVPNQEIEYFFDHLDQDIPFHFHDRKFDRDEWKIY